MLLITISLHYIILLSLSLNYSARLRPFMASLSAFGQADWIWYRNVTFETSAPATVATQARRASTLRPNVDLVEVNYLMAWWITLLTACVIDTNTAITLLFADTASVIILEICWWLLLVVRLLVLVRQDELILHASIMIVD